MLTLNIDGNKFEFDTSKSSLKINDIDASEREESLFNDSFILYIKNDYDNDIFYQNYDIVGLDDLSYKIKKFNIFEMNRGCCNVASYWGSESAYAIKQALNAGYNGGEPLNCGESIMNHLDHYIDRNYKLFTRLELRDFIINREDLYGLCHKSVVTAINKL